MLKKILLGVSLIGVGLYLGACSNAVMSAGKSVMSLSTAKVWLEKVQFRCDDDMNDNSPLTVHLLILYKQDVYDTLAKTTAEDYFKQAEQLKKDNPNQIDFIKWELVPGQSKEEQTITPTRMDGVGALIFARYNSPGDHRVAISDERQVRLNLEKVDLGIEKIS